MCCKGEMDFELEQEAFLQMRMAGGGRAVQSNLRTSVALLLTYFLAFAGSDFVGQSVEGEVEEGNYTYYTLKQTGDVRLELISMEGDADLYVGGEEEERPTYMFESHYMSSTTCGLDVLALPHYFKRPVHIGVYGHPRHPVSKYLLQVVIVEDREFDPFSAEEESTRERREEREAGGESQRKSRGGGGEKSDFWTGEQSTVKMIFTILRHILEIVLDIMI